MPKTNKYQFIITTDNEDYLSFKEDHVKFDGIILSDSIYSFFPRLTINLPDTTGLYSEKFFFLEGMKYNVKFGDEDGGYLEPSFYWSEDRLSAWQGGITMAGHKAMEMVSAFDLLDAPKSKSYEDTISNVIKTIADEFAVDKSYITTTGNQGIWYQPWIKNTKFIDSLLEVAMGTNDEKSPFYSFFNLHNEFYFQNMAELMKGTPEGELNTLHREKDPSQRILEEEIKNIEYSILGSMVNKDNYCNNYHSIKADGTLVTVAKEKISDHVYNGDGKLAILKDLTNEVSDNIYIGLEDGYSPDEIKGKINRFYVDSNLMFRLQLLTVFNRKFVSGKNVDIKIGSIEDAGKTFATEFSGNWLISQSTHHYDERQTANTELEIIRPFVKVNSDNLYLSDFLS